MNLAPLPIEKFFDNNGRPMNGGLLFTYVAGTTTKVATYTDSTGGTPNTNPIVLDYRGEARVWLDPMLVYKFTLAPPGDTDPPTKPIWTVDNITSAISFADLTQQIIGRILYPQTAAEIAAGVTPVLYYWPPYVRGRYNNFTDWRLACDQAGAEGQLEADYAITSNTYLPKKSDFKGFKITGLFQTIHAYHGSAINPGSGWVHNWRAARPFIAGTYACDYTGVDTLGDANADKLLVMGGDGVGANAGCFWNEVSFSIAGQTEINCDRFDVNFNWFKGGLCRYVHITGGGGGSGQAHANTFEMVDMAHSGGAPASSGFLQDDATRAKNFLLGLYYENNNTQIIGNVDIKNYQGDTSQGLPLTDRFNHIMGTTGINPRVSRDFLSLTVHNAARGGVWDWLDTSGKPPCLTNSGGAGAAVVADTTEPCGIAKRYEATYTVAFSGFSISIQPNGTDRFGIDLFYKSTADFAAIESNDGTGTTSYGTTPVVVDSTNNWKLLRISGPASKTAVTGLTLYAYAGTGGAAKVMSISGIFAGGELAVVGPHKNQDFESGLYTPTLSNTTNIAASTAFAMQYSRVGNTVTVAGLMNIDPTAAAPTASSLGISLPIAPHTAFSASAQCGGVGGSENGQVGAILADSVNNRAILNFNATNAANATWGVSFSYRMS